ncbi:hypothetical protein PanWU01x14_285090 [Parasponia andersonii]|uniref:Uncharacterized protein n=1 Tax=Parasponia andersonii TaxID=3476 RepID=A0A2P5AZQ3_PARAD|nr:hypothetical protein PanWU01x14_285090 [Parasponia andersonii]
MGALGLLTPPIAEVRVAVPRQQTHGASDRQLSWLGSDRLDRLGSVMGSALDSDDPKADGEITCDPRGPDLLQGSGMGPTTAPISLFDRFMSIKWGNRLFASQTCGTHVAPFSRCGDTPSFIMRSV